MDRKEVFAAIEVERAHQIRKYGADKQQSLPGFFLIMRNELREAEDAWTRGPATGRDSAMHEVLQIAATAVAALEKYGVDGCPMATDDGPCAPSEHNRKAGE